MTKSIYDAYLLFKPEPLKIIGLQTDDIFILADNVFATLEEDAIIAAKIMTKDRYCLTIILPIKFSSMKIELHLPSDITLRQKSHVSSISLIKSYDASSASAKNVVRMKLSSKEQYVAQQA